MCKYVCVCMCVCIHIRIDIILVQFSTSTMCSIPLWCSFWLMGLKRQVSFDNKVPKKQAQPCERSSQKLGSLLFVNRGPKKKIFRLSRKGQISFATDHIKKMALLQKL